MKVPTDVACHHGYTAECSQCSAVRRSLDENAKGGRLELLRWHGYLALTAARAILPQCDERAQKAQANDLFLLSKGQLINLLRRLHGRPVLTHDEQCELTRLALLVREQWSIAALRGLEKLVLGP